MFFSHTKFQIIVTVINNYFLKYSNVMHDATTNHMTMTVNYRSVMENGYVDITKYVHFYFRKG